MAGGRALQADAGLTASSLMTQERMSDLDATGFQDTVSKVAFLFPGCVGIAPASVAATECGCLQLQDQLRHLGAKIDEAICVLDPAEDEVEEDPTTSTVRRVLTLCSLHILAS